MLSAETNSVGVSRCCGLEKVIENRRFIARYGKRKKTLMYGYVEDVILISSVFWASGTQTISDLNHASAFVNADPMLVSTPEK